MRRCERLACGAVVAYASLSYAIRTITFSRQQADRLTGLRRDAWGLLRDDSDAQWRSWRGSLAPLAAFLVAHAAANWLAFRSSWLSGGRARSLAGEARGGETKEGRSPEEGTLGWLGAKVTSPAGPNCEVSAARDRPGGGRREGDDPGDFVLGVPRDGSAGGVSSRPRGTGRVNPPPRSATRSLAGSRALPDAYPATSPSLLLRCFLGVAFVSHLHGPRAVLVLGLLAFWHGLVRRLAGRRTGRPTLWAAALTLFLVVRSTDGFSRWPTVLQGGSAGARAAGWGERLARLLAGSPLVSRVASAFGRQAGRIPRHATQVLRWDICFNLVLLRMLSYGLDCHEAARVGATPASVAATPAAAAIPATAAAATARPCREQTLAPLGPAPPSPSDHPAEPTGSRLSLALFLAYTLYPPLYATGPIVRFERFRDDIEGLERRECERRAGADPVAADARAPSPRRLAPRALALALVDLAAAEVMTRLMFPNALTLALGRDISIAARVGGVPGQALSAAARRAGMADTPASGQDAASALVAVGLTTPLDLDLLAAVSWHTLAFMWLKFTAIWRVARVAALLDGVLAPENQLRCFADNADAEGFWRSWHASFNAWLVRYLYVPLGGKTRKALVIPAVFLFVALWHDLELRLLGWAAMVCVAFLPEMHAVYPHLVALLAAVNVAFMLAGNLAGFGLGVPGTLVFIHQLPREPGFCLRALSVLYCAARLTLDRRQREEAARGVPARAGH